MDEERFLFPQPKLKRNKFRRPTKVSPIRNDAPKRGGSTPPFENQALSAAKKQSTEYLVDRISPKNLVTTPSVRELMSTTINEVIM